MRENIGQYVDARTELGVSTGELFITADLFEDKNWKIVLKNIHGLARRCHYDVPGFWGPNIGIRKKNRTGGGGLAASMAAAAPVESSMKELMTRGASASIAPLPKGLQDVKDESKLRTESL